MRRFSQRFRNTEEKKNVRSAVMFIVLTIAAVCFIFFIGIPVLGKFTAFVSGLRGGNKQINKSDTTPPAPPKFNYFPEFTNQQNVTITGNSEAGATIKITIAGDSQEVLADNTGAFSLNLTLNSGTTNFSAIATDQAGNVSTPSKEYQVTFDNKPPELIITSPSDNSSFFGSNQRQLTIQGKTEQNCQVNIGDRVISIDDEGVFQYTTTLNEGNNSFTIKSVDQAGNSTEKTATYNFTP